MFTNFNNPLPYFDNPFLNNVNANSIVKVNGVDGAKQFQMRPNDMVALFDANEDVFYIKTTDGAGFASLRKFRYNEETDTPVNNNEFVTRKEFNELLENIKNGNVIISNTET